MNLNVIASKMGWPTMEVLREQVSHLTQVRNNISYFDPGATVFVDEDGDEYRPVSLCVLDDETPGLIAATTAEDESGKYDVEFVADYLDEFSMNGKYTAIRDASGATYIITKVQVIITDDLDIGLQATVVFNIQRYRV